VLAAGGHAATAHAHRRRGLRAAGTFSVTGSSSVGTSTVVPSIAAVSGTLTLVVTLRPRRSKTGIGRHVDVDEEVTGRAPCVPGLPLP